MEMLNFYKKKGYFKHSLRASFFKLILLLLQKAAVKCKQSLSSSICLFVCLKSLNFINIIKFAFEFDQLSLNRSLGWFRLLFAMSVCVHICLLVVLSHPSDQNEIQITT